MSEQHSTPAVEIQKREKTPEETALQIGRITSKLVQRAAKLKEVHPDEIDRVTGTKLTTENGNNIYAVNVDSGKKEGLTSATIVKRPHDSIEAHVSGDIGNMFGSVVAEKSIEESTSVKGAITGKKLISEGGFTKNLSDKGITTVAAEHLSTVRDVLAQREIVNNGHIVDELAGNEINTDYVSSRPQVAARTAPLPAYGPSDGKVW